MACAWCLFSLVILQPRYSRASCKPVRNVSSRGWRARGWPKCRLYYHFLEVHLNGLKSYLFAESLARLRALRIPVDQER